MQTGSPLERQVGQAVICMCGTCGRRLVGECTCSYAASMRAEIKALVEQERSKEEILDF
jgi:cytochrome c-type biogenesis protein CcmH/NrfF